MASASVPANSIKPSGAAEAANAYRKERVQARAEDKGPQGDVSASGFAQLLQSADFSQAPLSTTNVVVANEILQSAQLSEQLAFVPLPIAVVGGKLEVSIPLGVPLAQNSSRDDLAWMAGDLTCSFNSLLGQTAQLDQAADMALRNGSNLQIRQDAGDPLAMNRKSVGAAPFLGGDAVAVVAQGVEAAVDAAQSGARNAKATMGALGDAAQGTSGLSSMGKAMDVASQSSATPEEPLRGERSADGKVNLQGQWMTVDRQAPPAEVMQRILGQMSQFLSASGGSEWAGTRRSGARAVSDEGASIADGGTAAQAGSGAGRLTEYAVSQAAASQQAQNGEAQSADAEPNMAFWMNASQQRAEMVLDRDGKPVRVQVTLQGNAAHVTFLSDEPATRSMLDASVAQLRDMLAAQGMELAGVQVNTQASGGQDGGAETSDRFMPEGARRVRLPASDLSTAEVNVRAPAAGAASGRGVDIFA